MNILSCKDGGCGNSAVNLIIAILAMWQGVCSLKNANKQLQAMRAENERRASEIVLFAGVPDIIFRLHPREAHKEIVRDAPGLPSALGFAEGELKRLTRLRVDKLTVRNLSRLAR